MAADVRDWRSAGAKQFLFTLAAYKLGFFLLAVLIVRFVPWWNQTAWRLCVHWPFSDAPDFTSHFATWDGAHYLRLASEGYTAGTNSCAFYPLWPLLIAFGSLVTRDVFWSGILLANVLSCCAFWQFYRLTEERHGEQTARFSLVLLLAFPGAIFFNFIYTEALYLLLVVLFFRYLHRSNYVAASIVAFLLPLTKAIGIFIIVPFLWHMLERKCAKRQFLWLCTPLVGYAMYFAVMYLHTGNALEGFEAQMNFPTKPSAEKLVDLGGALRALFNIDSFHGTDHSLLDRICFAIMVVTLPLIWRLDKVYFAFAVFAGLIPAFSNSFWSYSRLMIVCYPVFIAMADWYQRHRESNIFRWSTWYYLALAVVIQLWLLARHLNFIWAS